jgi:hypothetical protein
MFGARDVSRFVAIAFATAVASGAATACDESDPSASRHVTLRGTYDATGDGRIAQITFTKGGEYQLRAKGCDAADCEERGRYALDAPNKTLALTPDAGASRTLPFDVVEATPAVESGKLVGKNLTQGGDEALLAEPQSLVEPGTVQSALIDGEPVQLTTAAGTCLLAQIQVGLVEGGEGACGFYQKKECDPGKVISYYEKDLIRILPDAAGCVTCGGSLAAGAIVAAGGTVGSDGILSIPSGKLGAALAVAGCIGCWKSLEDNGLIAAADCTLVPCQYTPEARQKECQMTCQTAYAYVPKVGYACQCTNDATEACCRVSCDQGTKINASTCTCDQIPRTPPPPKPECEPGRNGYSCSSDPDTKRDRACCNGACVIWNGSACDK